VFSARCACESHDLYASSHTLQNISNGVTRVFMGTPGGTQATPGKCVRVCVFWGGCFFVFFLFSSLLCCGFSAFFLTASRSYSWAHRAARKPHQVSVCVCVCVCVCVSLYVYRLTYGWFTVLCPNSFVASFVYLYVVFSKSFTQTIHDVYISYIRQRA
jgi:hypothetical protein